MAYSVINHGRGAGYSYTVIEWDALTANGDGDKLDLSDFKNPVLEVEDNGTFDGGTITIKGTFKADETGAALVTSTVTSPAIYTIPATPLQIWPSLSSAGGSESREVRLLVRHD